MVAGAAEMNTEVMTKLMVRVMFFMLQYSSYRWKLKSRIDDPHVNPDDQVRPELLLRRTKGDMAVARLSLDDFCQVTANRLFAV